MPIMRDILAKFAINVDVSPLTEMDRKINKLKGELKTMGTVAAAAFGGASFAMLHMVELASSADESLNRVKRTFKEFAPEVLDWSKEFGATVGRSRYKLQASADAFGAFLAPKFQDDLKLMTQMSRRLGELTVDLASFYDISDEEASMRLFSGLAGETEAVRRLGIDISDAALKELNAKKGGKKYDSLGQKDKTLLRFEKMMTDTEDKQKDATLTAKEWANSLKRAKDMFHELQVDLGRLIKKVALPLLHSLEGFAKKGIKIFKDLAERTHAFETALLGCVTAVTALTLRLGYLSIASLSMAKLVAYSFEFLAVVGKIGLALGAFLIVEDVYTFLKGGDSILGSWLKSVSGLSQPLDAVEGAFESISVHLHNAFQYAKALVKTLGIVPRALGGLADDGLSGAKAAIMDTWKLDTIDLDSVRAQREEQRSNSFSQAVREGALEEAATKFKRPGETREEAFERAKKDRASLLATDPSVMPNEKDVNSGLAPKGMLPMQSIVGQGPSMEVGAIKQGSVGPSRSASKVIHIGQITVNARTDASPEQIAEAFDEKLREAEASDGEELPE
jgi:hypothetical protein